MRSRALRFLLPLWVAVAAVVVLRAADPVASPKDAEALKRKIAGIAERSAAPLRQSVRTTVTEREVNAYLAYEAQDELPVGVVNPSVLILGTGRISGRAVVDLDRVREERKPTSLFDPRSYLTGRLPVTATGVLQTGNGIARFQLESANIAGVPIPKSVLQQILSYYSRSSEHPSGVRLDDPLALPARIREIQILRGQAIVIQ